MAETDREVKNKERLAKVTEKLLRIEEERAWAMSEEGKAANKELKEAELRLKKQQKLIDKEASFADTKIQFDQNQERREAELAELQRQITIAKTQDAADDRKAQKKFNKQERKLQEKLRQEQRDFGSELYDSIFGTYSLIGSIKNMFPKPVQILAGWGFDKIKKGTMGAVKGIGKIAKGGFDAMFGKKPDADAPAAVKAAAAETAEAPVAALESPAEVVPTETITGKKFSDSELRKAHQMGKGAAFGTHPETGEALTDEQATAIKEGGVVPDSVIPQETAIGAPAATEVAGDEKGFVESIGPALSGMFSGGGDGAAKMIFNIGGMLHEDLQSILFQLEKFVEPATTEGSIFTHDKSVEDKIDEQTDDIGDDLTKLEPEEIDASKADELAQEVIAPAAGGGAGGGGGKKKGGIFSSLKGFLGGGKGGGGGIGGMLGGLGKGLAGLGKGIAGIGKGVGGLIAGLLQGIAKGLLAFANPMVAAGAVAFGVAIAAVGAGIAGAAWITGKAMPTFAEGMKSFEELDGDKLIQAGKGMAAVAGGMAAFGAGTAVAGLGSLVGGITSGIVGLFGGDTPLEKMQKFQEYNFNAKKIKENADAMVAYGKAMAVMGAAQGIGGIGAAVGAVGGAIAGFFGAENPLDKMLKFQAYTFDTEKIKTNAAAVKAYAEAIKDFPTAPAASVFTAAKDAIIGLLGGETDPFAPMKKFGELKLNKEQIVSNSAAVKAYAEAVKDFPASPAASVMTAAKDAIIGLLGGEVDPFAPLKKFGELVLNTEGIKTNAVAVKAYGEAVKDFPTAPAASVFTAAKDAIIGLLGGDTDPFTPLKKFGEMKLNKEQIVSNSAAVVAYSNAIKDLPAAPEASVTKAAKDAIIGLLGGETDPFAPMVKFGELKLNKEQIIANAQAVSAFGTAMSTVPEIKAERTGGLLGAIGNFFGGKKKMPWDQVKAFADADMGDPERLKENANALTTFGKSLAGLSAIPTDIEDRLKGLGNGLEEFAKYIDDGEIETIKEFAEAMSKFPKAVVIGARPAAAGGGGGGSSGTDDSGIQELVKAGTTKGSLFTHDFHVENVLRKGFGMPTGGDAASIQPPDSISTPGNDIVSAASSMYGDGGMGVTANLVNAPVSNVRSSKTIVNLPQNRLASDPNTQKQSGYALSGWAKFD